MKNITIEYSKNEEQVWRSKKGSPLFPRKMELFQSWMRKYPNVFRLEDWNFMQNQPQYHFHECIVAKYFGDKGYGVLIEKYDLDSGLEKYDIFKRRALKAFDLCEKEEHVQPPDLFIFKPGETFFVEVKGPRDKIRQNQEIFFRKLENIGFNIQLAETRPK